MKPLTVAHILPIKNVTMQYLAIIKKVYLNTLAVDAHSEGGLNHSSPVTTRLAGSGSDEGCMPFDTAQ